MAEKISKKKLVEELKEQDQQINAIFARREELRDIAKEAGIYDKVWDMLHSDGESHWSF